LLRRLCPAGVPAGRIRREEPLVSPQASCIVYCRSWCGDCQRALRWLDEKGYVYDLRDIEEDPAAHDRCVELAGKVVTPTFEIGDTCVVNFDPHVLAEALGEPPAR
jgi:mycoredoxin